MIKFFAISSIAICMDMPETVARSSHIIVISRLEAVLRTTQIIYQQSCIKIKLRGMD